MFKNRDEISLIEKNTIQNSSKSRYLKGHYSGPTQPNLMNDPALKSGEKALYDYDISA